MEALDPTLHCSNMHFDIQGLEYENLFWIRINLKTITSQRVAVVPRQNRLLIKYILPDVTVIDGELKIRESPGTYSVALPENLDMKNYRRHIDKKSVTLIFTKMYTYA